MALCLSEAGVAVEDQAGQRHPGGDGEAAAASGEQRADAARHHEELAQPQLASGVTGLERLEDPQLLQVLLEPVHGHEVRAHPEEREAARRASTSGTAGSPPAMEATLASISAEVTAEAIERLERAAMPKARVVVLPEHGHSVGQYGCLPRLVTLFVDRGSAATLDTRCVRTITPPPFALR